MRQTFSLHDLNGRFKTPTIAYDPVTRIVTVTPQSTDPLDPGQTYRLDVVAPMNADDMNGLRAIDGATIANPPLQITFVAAGADGGVQGVGLKPAPKISFCNDVFPPLLTKCTASICHGATELPAAGLLLDTPGDIGMTAIGRVAQGSNTGPASTTQSPGRVFGVDMPIIDPGSSQPPTGNPGNSWLLYKLLLAVPATCSTTPGALPCDGGTGSTEGGMAASDAGMASADAAMEAGDAGTAAPMAPPTDVSSAYDVHWLPLTDAERKVLSDLIPGREMPFPTNPAAANGTTGDPLTLDELERVSLWIQQGAAVPNCP